MEGVVRSQIPTYIGHTTMSDWSLPKLLSNLHDDIEGRLFKLRGTVGHSTSKGDASERVWNELLNTYLPKRYASSNAFVVDSRGQFSDQIDVVVFDRQYSPFIFSYEGVTVVPAESVYAIFEAKQTANAFNVEYAQRKAESVRRLHRTSLPIPYAGGEYPPKQLFTILAGILTLESEWNPPLGESAKRSLRKNLGEGCLDIGCVASSGHFFRELPAYRAQSDVSTNQDYEMVLECKPATGFLFKLISMLQIRGTVPMIDIEAYSSWLQKS